MGNTLSSKVKLALMVVASLGLTTTACDPSNGEVDGAVGSRNASAVGELRATPKPRRGKLIRPEVVARTVQWEELAAVQTASIDRLDHRQLDTSPVPVLVPPQFDEGATLTTGESWYALSARHDGVEISLQGSAQGRLIPGIRAHQPTHTIRDNPGFVTRNEGIWSVSWTENGAAYSLEVGCADPFAPECDDEVFALGWVDQLVLGGGQGVQR